jgi:hypothetical protein
MACMTKNNSWMMTFVVLLWIATAIASPAQTFGAIGVPDVCRGSFRGGVVCPRIVVMRSDTRAH